MSAVRRNVTAFVLNVVHYSTIEKGETFSYEHPVIGLEYMGLGQLFNVIDGDVEKFESRLKEKRIRKYDPAKLNAGSARSAPAESDKPVESTSRPDTKKMRV